MAIYNWSQTPETNAHADPLIDWAEGQPPSSINDSARQMMAATAKWRDDIAGAIVTTGSATAYSVSSFSVFDTLAHLSGQVIAFTPHVTNAAGPVTLNIDVLGAKPLRTAPNAELQAGVIIQGTPYEAIYNNTDGAFYLRAFYSSPFLIPLGATLDYWAPTAPNSSFAFPFGQPMNRTTYATLFALIGTTYGAGAGDGLTFSLPDLRGRVVASPDNMGGTTANRLVTGSLAAVRHTVGGAGGEDGHVLAASEIPTITSAVSTSGTLSGQTNSFNVPNGNTTTGGGSFPASAGLTTIAPGVNVSGNMSGSATSNNTGSAPHNNVQPTILGNRIMRVI
jgi:microcystin-dependent protein